MTRTLEGLQKSLADMNMDELLEMVRTIRAERVIKQDSPRARKSSGTKKKDKLKSLFDGLSAAEKALLLEKLSK